MYMADVFSESSSAEGDADTLDMTNYKQKTAAPVLREKTMDFVHTAVQYIASRDFIGHGAKRIGLDTIWDKSWGPFAFGRPVANCGNHFRGMMPSLPRAVCKTSPPLWPPRKCALNRSKRLPTR